MALTIHRFDDGRVAPVALAELPALLAAGAHLWIDAAGEDPGLGELLTTTLALHPLAVEDILSERLRPKIEDYGDYLYVVDHGIVRRDGAPNELRTVELDVVLTKQWIFTHHDEPSLACDAVRTELARNPRPLERGPAFVAHAILDHLIDYYLPIVDELDDAVEDVAGRVVTDPSRRMLARIFELKSALHHLRRIALHQREVLLRLSRGEFEIVPPEALPFYRDVYDHFVRVADLADSNREILSGALDAYLSVVSNRMNEVMKALTIVATIMLPMTFVVGVYGMNFEHMPELHWQYGYLYVWMVLVAIPIGMLAWFRRQRWL